jgi:hypothetical protein
MEVTRLTPTTVFAVISGMREDRVWLGVAPAPLDPDMEGIGSAEELGPRILVVVEQGEGGRIKPSGLQALGATLADPEVEARILAAEEPRAIMEIRPLLAVPLREPFRVAHALVPLEHWVYPDTPLHEVLDLIARKRVAAVPVVGSAREVLGILTAGDALRLSLERGVRSEMLAREVMTRAVLCVTEEQDLSEAARMMVTRNLRQLPVVRSGEVVGLLTRESALLALVVG